MKDKNEENKPSMLRRILLIVGGLVLVCILFFAFTFGVAWVATSGVADAGNAFMTALQNNDMDAAYAMFTPALQEEVGTEQLSEMFTANVFEGDALESWSFTSRNVNNNVGDVSGTATVGDRTFIVALEFIKSSEGVWLLNAFQFNPQP
jgi:hypothetical protein